MKILNSLMDYRIGGPQTRALMVAHELKNYGIRTEFLLPNDGGDFGTKVQNEGFVVHTPGLPQLKPPSMILENVNYGLHFPLTVRRIQHILKNNSIDIVHANTSLNIDAALATTFSDSSLVWHFNDVFMGWPLNRITSILAKLLAEEIIVASRGVADNYFKSTSRDLNVVPAPVDTIKFDPDSVNESDIRTKLDIKDSVIIGTVGNINPLKGHEHLIKAVAELQRSMDIEIVAVVVGEKLATRESYYKRMKKLCCDLGVEENIKFVGRRSNIPQILKSVDIFAFPSTAEASPMAVLEAMAMEKPIVATHVGGIPEQIVDGESGWLVPPKDPNAIAHSIKSIISDPTESNRRAKNARERVKGEFSLKKCVERHVNVYQKAFKN